MKLAGIICGLAVAVLLGLVILDEAQTVPRPAPTADAQTPPALTASDTNGVFMPEQTPFEGDALLKANYLKGFCEGYHQAQGNPDDYSFITRCCFGGECATPEWRAADEGWIAGQDASNKRKKISYPIGGQRFYINPVN
jgi:hypothetical protein